MSAQRNDRLEALTAAIPSVIESFQDTEHRLVEIVIRAGFFNTACFTFNPIIPVEGIRWYSKVEMPFVAIENDTKQMLLDMAAHALKQLIAGNTQHKESVRRGQAVELMEIAIPSAIKRFNDKLASLPTLSLPWYALDPDYRLSKIKRDVDVGFLTGDVLCFEFEVFKMSSETLSVFDHHDTVTTPLWQVIEDIETLPQMIDALVLNADIALDANLVSLGKRKGF